MYDEPENDRRTVAARRAKRKAARRTAKARRSAAIEEAWLRHMGVLTPAEETAEAARAAEEAAVEWPADLPKPGEGRRFPSPRAIAKWLGVPVRRFDPHEITALVTAWATAARDAGLPVNVSTTHGKRLPQTLRPERSGRTSR